MPRCVYCRQKKGKRACPALDGSICSPCCGQHRRREIRCPADCPFLPSTSPLLHEMQQRVIDFAMTIGPHAEAAVNAWFGPGKREIHDWEDRAFLGYLAYGHERSPGDRAVERFDREHRSSLNEDERTVLDALLGAWPGLFEVLEVVPERSIRMRDISTGEEVQVREKLATRGTTAGDRLLAWVMRLDGEHLLTGAGALVPPAHAGLIERTLAQTEGCEGHARVRKALPQLHRVLRDAVANWVPPRIETAEGY